MEIQLIADKWFDISIADTTTQKIIYEGEKIEDKITISNKTDKELFVNISMNEMFVSFSNETNLNTTSVRLNFRETKEISIYYTCPQNYNNGEEKVVKIRAEADYSLPIDKDVNIRFQSKENPTPVIKFNPLNPRGADRRQIHYYKGGGKVKIGILEVSINNENTNLDRRGYKPLDLTSIRIDRLGQLNIDCLTIDMTNKPEQLIIGKDSVFYDIYCEYDGEQLGDYVFGFTLLNKSASQFTLRIREQIPPQEKIVFTPLESQTIYYKGEGKRKIGVLEITAKGEDGEIFAANRDKYKFLDLSNLSVIDNKGINLRIDKTDKPEQLIIGEDSVFYDIYCDYNGEIKGEVSFGFTLCNLDNNENTTPYRMKIFKQGTPVYNEFEPIEKLDFSTLKDTGIVGHLISNYTSNKDDKRYYTIKNGVYKITDENYSFDKKGKVKEQFLEVGDKKYPIYINFNKVFGDKLNIDQDAYLNIQELQYTDSRDTDVIDALLTLKHTPAKPEPHVYLTTNYSDENKELVQDNLEFKQWRYDSNLRLHMQSYEIANLHFSNRQELPCGDNKIKWGNIKIEGDCIKPFNGIDDIEIKNGENTISIPITVDLSKITNETNNIAVNIEYNKTVNDLDVADPGPSQFSCTINIPILEEVVDDWYSIDLGTTGIVVAKWNYESETDDFDGISAIELKDSEKPIESSRNIVSSITILKPSTNNKNIGEIVVAPSTTELKQSAKHVLVPTKFMVGQDVLPFINIYRNTFPEGLILVDKTYNWEEITPKKILEYTYNTIFSKISEGECDKIRKLIITYPNTYTPQSLDWLRNMIISSGIFKNLSERNLHFIPESDSVVAYYIKKSMERENNKATENVVIYDMGAGTLDLSYVKIFVEQENEKLIKKSIIEKRIGIPIAGEYFSYLIYEDFKEKFVKDTKANYTTKGWVENFKKEYGTSTTLGNIKFENETIINSSHANDPIELGDTINKWINTCTNDAFVQLFGNEKWGDMVDRIVLSGRGSQFKPVQDKLKELAKDNKITLDLETISLSELKQCVAEGAILYQKIFENSSMPFSILHRNSYERIGIKYRVIDENFTKKWVYKELMTESNLIWDKCIKDGALFAQVPPFDIKDLDFRLDDDIVFYLTTLCEDEMQQLIKEPGSEKEAFINELFRFKPRVLTSTSNREKCVINLSIDSNNVLKISINSMDLLPHSTLPNVEYDKFYVKCNWYFNN